VTKYGAIIPICIIVTSGCALLDSPEMSNEPNALSAPAVENAAPSSVEIAPVIGKAVPTAAVRSVTTDDVRRLQCACANWDSIRARRTGSQAQKPKPHSADCSLGARNWGRWAKGRRSTKFRLVKMSSAFRESCGARGSTPDRSMASTVPERNRWLRSFLALASWLRNLAPGWTDRDKLRRTKTQ
jgi:hypothetical protein